MADPKFHTVQVEAEAAYRLANRVRFHWLLVPVFLGYEQSDAMARLERHNAEGNAEAYAAELHRAVHHQEVDPLAMFVAKRVREPILQGFVAETEETLTMLQKASAHAANAVSLAAEVFDRGDFCEEGAYPWRLMHMERGIQTTMGEVRKLLEKAKAGTAPTLYEVGLAVSYALTGLAVADGSYDADSSDDSRSFAEASESDNPDDFYGPAEQGDCDDFWEPGSPFDPSDDIGDFLDP